MSKFHTDTNKGRVAKMTETLGHLQKSARSNKASTEEIEKLLLPMLAALGDLGIVTTAGVPNLAPAAAPVEDDDLDDLLGPEPAPRAEVPGGAWSSPKNAPGYAQIRDAAAVASLEDLTYAMAVFSNRIDDLLGLPEVKAAVEREKI